MKKNIFLNWFIVRFVICLFFLSAYCLQVPLLAAGNQTKGVSSLKNVSCCKHVPCCHKAGQVLGCVGCCCLAACSSAIFCPCIIGDLCGEGDALCCSCGEGPRGVARMLADTNESCCQLGMQCGALTTGVVCCCPLIGLMCCKGVFDSFSLRAGRTDSKKTDWRQSDSMA
jgi:hypothetical protein